MINNYQKANKFDDIQHKYLIHCWGIQKDYQPIAIEKTVVSKIARYMLDERNIYIPSDKFGIWIVPPLVINKEEIDFVVEAIDDALDIADSKVSV
ncbi:hypothetical protein GF312_05665 [Candidatus Poribacteria bacterium]|nr:hypothetical protein [Candidatus Poribacteria bacterium]